MSEDEIKQYRKNICNFLEDKNSFKSEYFSNKIIEILKADNRSKNLFNGIL